MKLATYQDGSRDGQLVVVSRDLSQAHFATHIANRLQAVLDDWNYLAPQLQDLSDALNAGRARHPFAFDTARCMAPLPRAYQSLRGAAYLQHLELQYRARGLELPEEMRREPLLFQSACDDLLGPQAPFVCASEAFGVDFEAQLVAITADVPLACAADRAIDSVRLLMLGNSLRLRHLSADVLPQPGQLLDAPNMACSPVAVTPDELGNAWSRGRVGLNLQCSWNGRKIGHGDTAADMDFHFGQLIAQATKTRRLRAGTLVASGPVSVRGAEKKGAAKGEPVSAGIFSLVEKRALETLQEGKPATDYLKAGDSLRLELKNDAGQSVFGTIDLELQVPVTGG